MQRDQTSSSPALDSVEGLPAVIDVLAAQLKRATDDATRDISSLSAALLDMSRRASEIAKSTKGPVGEAVSLNRAILAATARLQFADRMHQRLDNIAGNLDSLSQALGANPGQDIEWNELLCKLRNNYTMESERAMFDARLFGERLADPEGGPASEPLLFTDEAGYGG